MYEKQSLCYKICLVLWDIINLKKKKKKRGCLYEENKPNWQLRCKKNLLPLTAPATLARQVGVLSPFIPVVKTI